MFIKLKVTKEDNSYALLCSMIDNLVYQAAILTATRTYADSYAHNDLPIENIRYEIKLLNSIRLYIYRVELECTIQ